MSAVSSQEVQAPRQTSLPRAVLGMRSVLSAHQSRPLPTLSRSTVHVTILFQQLNEPSEASPAPPGQYFRSLLHVKGRMAGGECQV